MVEQKFEKEGRVKEIFIERCVLANLDHPAIIKLYDSFKHRAKFCLLVEYCKRGSLLELQKREGRLKNELASHFTAEIVVALQYLRLRGIVHRDLKPGNIVLSHDYHIKLIDFATCKILENPSL